MATGKVYLIPTVLHEDEKALQTIPAYVQEAVKECSIFFVENEKTARRFLKKLWKDFIIDDQQWYTIHKAEENIKAAFVQHLKQEKNIAILSEAGCPCIADPGQILVDAAQQINATVIPLVGPNSILLALMASGMSGQNFQFVGYLPVDALERKKMIKELEDYSFKKNCTQIFIETPYRNNAMIRDLLQTCKTETKLCIAANLTGNNEFVKTKKIKDWENKIPELHKLPAIFLLYAK